MGKTEEVMLLVYAKKLAYNARLQVM